MGVGLSSCVMFLLGGSFVVDLFAVRAPICDRLLHHWRWLLHILAIGELNAKYIRTVLFRLINARNTCRPCPI